MNLPVSTAIVMRPVWRRRQRRIYMHNPLPPPTDAEKSDAIRVLSLPDAMLAEMPAVWAEAMRILEESTEGAP